MCKGRIKLKVLLGHTKVHDESKEDFGMWICGRPIYRTVDCRWWWWWWWWLSTDFIAHSAERL